VFLALDSALRNPHSALEWTSFFMDDTSIAFPQRDISEDNEKLSRGALALPV
jgi:hypothetical protein